jgi:tRNA-splicing ligase RtcB (3'-phosphate/5'-hydroxy nucleic acid ligase)
MSLSDKVKIIRPEHGPPETRLDEVLESITRHTDVSQVVVLPDLHLKDSMESPSSLAISVDGFVVPQYTSSSVNCGMALAKTNLMEKDLDPRHWDRFFKHIKSKFPGDSWKKTITEDDAVKAASAGAEWAIDRYEFERDQLNHVAFNGNLFRNNQIDISTVREMNPESVLFESCFNFGQIGWSNHFIEFQVVDEILDPSIAQRFGLSRGQIMVMYHGGGGPYCGEIGRLFVPRKKHKISSWKSRLYRLKQKIEFHLLPANDLEMVMKRLSLYFISRAQTFIPKDSEEFDRIFLYNNLAMNFGFAYRIAALNDIREGLKNLSTGTEISLVYDLPHNLISRERVNGKEGIIHRHNSVMCYPKSKMGSHEIFKDTGQPVLLPGTNRTSSFLCVAEEGARDYLYSVDHGAGHTVDRFIRSSVSRPIGRATQRYRYNSDKIEELHHYDDLGVNHVLDQLKNRNIVRPVVRLRPVAGLT